MPVTLMKHGLYILTGPTACGKTETALRWAERHGAAILSCDAFCVYKGMDIGTAKPTVEEQGRVPHFGIDLVSVGHTFSVGAYLAYAKDVVARCEQEQRSLLIAGGSGFYLSSFFQPVVDDYAVTEEQKAEVRALEQQGGVDLLLQHLDALSPSGTGTLDRRNPRRVANALLRCMASGKALPELQAAFVARPSPFDAYPKHVCILDREDEELRERILRRVHAMLAGGLLDEVRILKEQGLEANLSAASAIGYRESLAFMRGEIHTEGALVEAIAANTWKLVRKQRSWFRKFLKDRQNWDPLATL